MNIGYMTVTVFRAILTTKGQIESETVLTYSLLRYYS